MRIWLALAINLAVLTLLFMFTVSLYLAIPVGLSVFGWLFYLMYRRQQKMEAKFQERFANQQIQLVDKRVHFRAQQSSGYSQTSGPGYLVLTDKELCFDMTLVDLSITIPVEKITAIDQVYRLLGVSPARKMLKIDYIDENGQEDAIALNPQDMAAWESALSRIALANRVSKSTP